MENKDKVILHLCCGKTMSDSKPYSDAGYTVIGVGELIGVENYYNIPKNVYGVIANVLCTHMSGSGARWWKDKDQDGRTLEHTKIITHCLRIIIQSKPKFWMIENPVGRLYKWLGDPVLRYQPCEYGDPYTKKTCLWGEFNLPKKNVVEPTDGSKMHLLAPSKDRSELRSICSPGFAKAFFEANQ